MRGRQAATCLIRRRTIAIASCCLHCFEPEFRPNLVFLEVDVEQLWLLSLLFRYLHAGMDFSFRILGDLVDFFDDARLAPMRVHQGLILTPGRIMLLRVIDICIIISQL